MFKFLRNLKLTAKFNIALLLGLGMMLTMVLVIMVNSVVNMTELSGQQRIREETRVMAQRIAEAEHEVLSDAKLATGSTDLKAAVAIGDTEATDTAVLIEAGALDMDIAVVVATGGERLATLAPAGVSLDLADADALFELAFLGIETTGTILENGHFFLVAALPVRVVSGEIVGVTLMGRLVDDAFLESLNFARENVHVALVYEDQVIAEHSTHNEHTGSAANESIAFNTLLDAQVLRQALSGETVVNEQLVANGEGVQFAVGYMPLVVADQSQAALILQTSLGELANLRKQLTINLVIIITGLTLLAATAMALFIRHVIIQRLNRLIIAAQAIGAGNLDESLPPGGVDEIGQLTSRFSEMRAQLRQTLDSLQARGRDLELAADVGRRVSQVRDLSEMLSDAVELMRDRFNLYYVQIYLTDPAGRSLLLRAGTGEAGQTLLERGHRLPIAPGSINGAAAAHQEAVIVADTEQSAAHKANPLLPHTRSEMAVPLIFGERLLGVLDLQSDMPGDLSVEQLPIFAALAAQLAIAIQNAVLFAETEQAQAAVEAQIRQATATGWQQFFNAVDRGERLGVAYDVSADAPLAELPSPAAGTQRLMADIAVTDIAVGTIWLEDEADRAWTAEEEEIVQAVAEKVARQVESLRLVNAAEQARYEAEQASRRLTREGWQTYLTTADLTSNGFVYDQNQVQPVNGDQMSKGDVSQPLVVRGESVGELALTGVNELNDDTTALIRDVAEKVSERIETLRLAQQTEMALGQTESLYQIGHALNAAANVDEILHAALGPILLTGIGEATLMFIELDRQGEPQTLELLAGWRMDGNLSFPVGTIFPMERFPFTRLFIDHPDAPQLIGDVASDERVDDFTRGIMAQVGIQAIAVIPLTLAGQWVGIITCSWPQPRTFSKQEEEIFNALINMAAPTMQSQRLFFKTKVQADKEHLINLINQRIQGTVTIESALQTAVKELGQALHASTKVKLNKITEKTQTDRLNPDTVAVHSINGDSH